MLWTPAIAAFAALIAIPEPSAQGPLRRPPVDPDEVAEPELSSIDITAYFADGPFKSAQQAVARGDTRSAVGLLKKLLKDRSDAPERPQARYLLGLSLMQLGEYEEAARLFEELSVTYPALKDDHLFSRGQALYLWGSYLDAADALIHVDPKGPRGEEARRLRAWALLKATDFERLVRWLEDIQRDEGELDSELSFILAHARHRTGDVLGAYRAFREVWREAPAGKLSGPALVHIAELKIGDKPMLSEGERAAIKALESRLLSGKDADGAMAALDRRLERAPESKRLRAEIAHARGRIAQAAGRLAAANQHYERALQLAPVEMAELRARVGVEEGRVYERLGQEQKALASYKIVAERFAELPESDDARFFAAEIFLSGRKYKEAQAEFEALLLKNPVTPHRPKCLWGIGWAHFRLGQYDRAVQFFGSLSKMRLPADVDVASHYWLGRSEASLGHTEEAEKAYRAVLRDHPLSHYAAYAEDQLSDVAEIKDSKREPDRAHPESERKKELVQVREYARLGLRQRALDSLSKFEKGQHKARRRPEEATLRSIARLYDDLGQNTEARRVREECAREFPRSLGDEELIAIAKRAHPLKFEEQIRGAANEFEISDSLLLGLIRTESGFHPEAVSNMYAYGLAQLILPTAQEIASRLRLGRATKTRLLRDPGFNIRIGTAYLRTLLDRYGGSEPLALAAYNAGPNTVDAWLAHRVRPLEGLGDAGQGIGLAPAPDELAEEIPIPETRNFVKTVLARARGYGRLYPRVKEPDVPASPLVQAGAFTEPADLAQPEKATQEPLRGSRVVGEQAMADERERVLYLPPPPP